MMMSGWGIWGSALALYALFRPWHDGLRKPLSKAQTETFFGEVHPYKLLGIPTTFSFPTQRELSAYVGPRVWVALVCALGAALVQLACG
jgi:hypothetical protein